MKRETVDGSKVALDAAELLLEDKMEEPGIELANPGGRGRHRHGFLTSSQHHLSTQRQL